MAAISDDLRRIPMSARLVGTLARAAEVAQAQYHAEVSLEHLLLALTDDPDAVQVLTASHVDIALVKADVSMFLGGLSSASQAAPIDQLSIAPDLRRILEASAAAASQGRRRDINGAIVLAAIVGDGKSSAAHMLRSQGLTFEEAIRALQRAMAAPPPDAEDVLANARARVQTRAMPGLPPVAPRAVKEVEATTDAAPADFQSRNEVAGVSENPNLERDASSKPGGAAARPRKASKPNRNAQYEDTPPQPPDPQQAAGRQPDPQQPLLIDSADEARAMARAEASLLNDGRGLSPRMEPTEPASRATFDDEAEAFGALTEYEQSQASHYAFESPGASEPGFAEMDSGQNSYDFMGGDRPPDLYPATDATAPPYDPSTWAEAAPPSWAPAEIARDDHRYVSAPPQPLDTARRPVAHEPAVMPPSSALGGGGQSTRPLPRMPQPGSRWPPPVGPASRQQDDQSHRWSDANGPSAVDASSGIVPPPLPPTVGPSDGESFPSDPGWPDARFDIAAASDGVTSHNDGPNKLQDGLGGAHFGDLAIPPPLDQQGGSTASRQDHGEGKLAEAKLTTEGKRRRRLPIDKALADQLAEAFTRPPKRNSNLDVELRIARSDALRMLEGLGADLQSGHAAPAITVQLHAVDSAFAIEGSTRETQWIESRLAVIASEFVVWRFGVMPLKSGRQRLLLAISARATGADGSAVETALPEQTVEVKIAANYGRAVLRVASWGLFAAAGAAASKYGQAVYEPAIASVLALIK